MQLRELLAQPQHLPTIPALVQNLIDSFAREDVSLGEIGRLITTDPGLSAKLLRLANSAYFRSARGIGSVDDALKLLGIKMARNLVIGSGLTAAFKAAPGMDIRQFWRYSLSTACIARWLAGPARQNSELGFMVGLLHGIGQFVMRAGMPQDMGRLDASAHPLDARRALVERAALGFDHGEVGAELARRWHFPESIVLGVGSVPRPLEGQPQSPVALMVHLAAWRARAEAFGDTREKMSASYPEAVAASLGVNKAWMPALLTHGEPVSRKDAMPELAELTAGLDEMIGGAPPKARQGAMARALMVAALSGMLLTFTLSAGAITDAEVEAVKREVEYAKAKADIAEQQARAAKANAERMTFEKNLPRPGTDPAAGAAPKPPADPKAAATAPKPPADAKKAAAK